MNEMTFDLLQKVVTQAVRVWKATAPAPVSCTACSDSGWLPAPLGSWRPLCPKAECALKRSYARPPF